MRRRRYLTALLAGGLTAAAGCTGGADGGPQPADDDGADDSESTTSEDDGGPGSDEPEAVDAVVGSLVEGDNLHLVVEDVEFTDRLGEFQEADEGNQYVVVQLALKNVTEEFVHVSQLLQASIRDDEDYSYNMTVAATDQPTFNDGQFAPGEVERGTIVFEVPEDASGLTLQFDLDASIFGGIDRAEIDLEDETDVHVLQQDLRIDTYGLGDGVEYQGVEVAVRGVETETQLGEFTQADQGHEYVIVDIEITNETGEEQRVSTALQMYLKDGDGWSYQEDLGATVELDRSFDESSALTDGETRAGELAYHVEEGLTPLYWVFEFTLWTEGDKTFWEIQ